MAGRPLVAPILDNKDGSATVRLPEALGSTRRITFNFPSREIAERYRAAAVAARAAGRPLPDPEPYKLARSDRRPEILTDGFADVAWAWWKKGGAVGLVDSFFP